MNILILGRGLAGSWLAHTFRQRGIHVRVYDPSPRANASRVAAGLINPTTGTRPKSTWRSEILLPGAHAAYAAFETEYGVSVWTPRRIRRIFLTEKDRDYWQAAVHKGIGVDWKGCDPGTVNHLALPYGGAEYDGATVDTNAVIDAVGARLEGEGAILNHEPHHDDYDVVVWATGWQASQHALWQWLPFQPVKGEILDGVIHGPPIDAVLIRGVWIVPGRVDEQGQHVRIGATHDWDDLTDQPTPKAREELLDKAQLLLGRPVLVTGQRAAVRPAMQSKRPVLGRHPEFPRYAIVNGLGAKGSLWAPWAASVLADHLLDGAEIDDEVSILRWWNP